MLSVINMDLILNTDFPY